MTKRYSKSGPRLVVDDLVGGEWVSSRRGRTRGRHQPAGRSMRRQQRRRSLKA
jgi:hypothetical protein